MQQKVQCIIIFIKKEKWVKIKRRKALITLKIFHNDSHIYQKREIVQSILHYVQYRGYISFSSMYAQMVYTKYTVTPTPQDKVGFYIYTLAKYHIPLKSTSLNMSSNGHAKSIFQGKNVILHLQIETSNLVGNKFLITHLASSLHLTGFFKMLQAQERG